MNYTFFPLKHNCFPSVSLFLIKKKKISAGYQKQDSMIDPLDLFPWDYNKLNSYSPIENSQPNTQTLLRHQHIRASEGGQISQARGEERKRSRDGCSDVAKAPCRTWEEGELGCGMHSLKPRAFLPEYSFLRSVYTMVESNNQGRDRIQRCDRCDRGVTPTSRYCQADNWVMGPGCLSPPSTSGNH